MHMTLVSATLAAATLFGSVVLADAVMVPGQITKIDEAQGKLTIEHGPIKKFDMDSMTMAFRTSDPAMLKTVKVGDKIQFHVDKIDGQFTVTKIDKAK